jgi:hypothetical protein
VAKAGEEIPSQQRRQTCINRAMPADFNHHAAKELEPLAIIDRQSPAADALPVFRPRTDSADAEMIENAAESGFSRTFDDPTLAGHDSAMNVVPYRMSIANGWRRSIAGSTEARWSAIGVAPQSPGAGS